MAKSNLNPLTDTPNSLTPITKDFMLGYIRAKATEEEKEWFLALQLSEKGGNDEIL